MTFRDIEYPISLSVFVTVDTPFIHLINDIAHAVLVMRPAKSEARNIVAILVDIDSQATIVDEIIPVSAGVR
jgi:ABC-type enterochelin transport system ATPase subunit